MRVALFGSRKADKGWTFRGSEDEFIAAARFLGRRLAVLEQTIIVGGRSRHTVDLHVVDGFVEEAAKNPETRARVEVVRPDDDVIPYEEHIRSAPHLFQSHPRTEGKWRGAHLTAIAHADVVVMLGGTKSTYYVGIATLLTRKPLIPIASFGGASDQLLDLVASAVEKDLQPEFRRLYNPWSEYVGETALRLGSLSTGPKILLIHGRSDDWKGVHNWLIAEGGVSDVTVMGQQFSAGEALPEKFERLARRVHGAIVVATPDDVGRFCNDAELRPRARQNVWVEVGWFWGRLGRDRVIVLNRSSIEIPSDLQGIEFFGYTDDPLERVESIRRFLRTIS